MNIARVQHTFTDLAADLVTTQQAIARLRASGSAPTLEINAQLDSLAHRLDDARLQYLQVFPTGTVTIDKLREDEISAAARAGCAKFLAKNNLPFPTGPSWDAPLDTAITDITRAATLLNRA